MKKQREELSDYVNKTGYDGKDKENMAPGED